MMREMFEGYLKQSEPLFERLDTVQSQLGYTETLIRRFIASDSRGISSRECRVFPDF